LPGAGARLNRTACSTCSVDHVKACRAGAGAGAKTAMGQPQNTDFSSADVTVAL
jgi:hypothetical protein